MNASTSIGAMDGADGGVPNCRMSSAKVKLVSAVDRENTDTHELTITATDSLPANSDERSESESIHRTTRLPSPSMIETLHIM